MWILGLQGLIESQKQHRVALLPLYSDILPVQFYLLLSFSAGNSYCNVYFDREETENEKRKKMRRNEEQFTPRSLPILPLIL